MFVRIQVRQHRFGPNTHIPKRISDDLSALVCLDIETLWHQRDVFTAITFWCQNAALWRKEIWREMLERRFVSAPRSLFSRLSSSFNCVLNWVVYDIIYMYCFRYYIRGLAKEQTFLYSLKNNFVIFIFFFFVVTLWIIKVMICAKLSRCPNVLPPKPIGYKISLFKNVSASKRPSAKTSCH